MLGYFLQESASHGESDRSGVGRGRTRERSGYDLSPLRAREVVEADFDQFDLILAMDWDNLALLEECCPPPYRRKLGRLTEHCRLHDSPVVPDPYAGGAQGFEEVLDLVEDACDGLLRLVRRQTLRA